MLANVTFPVFNEAAQLAVHVRRVAAFLARLPRCDWELVIADNGSRDGTLAEARALAREADPGFRKFDVGSPKAEGGSAWDHRQPLPPCPDSWFLEGLASQGSAPTIRVLHWDDPGRGRALKGAWLTSEADVLSYMDIDLSTDLAHLPALIATVAEGEADLAVGSRLARGAQTTRGWKRELLSRGYNQLLRSVLGLEVRDAQCGFKAISRAAASALLPQVQDEGFFFDTELLVLAQRQAWRIRELPVHWVDDPDSRVHLGRTIWRDLKGVCRLARA